MPTNRRAEPEALKRAQLITAARELFIQNGYEATPMAGIARTAKVTPNTIYWYFKDKDELLIAVLDEIFKEHLQEFLIQPARPLPEQLLWLVEKLRAVHRLVSTVHSRLHESAALSAWHAKFHSTVEGLLQAQLQPDLSEEQMAAEILIATFTIEGLITHGVAEDLTHQACQALAARWCEAPD